MSLAGLLPLFDELPAYKELAEKVAEGGAPSALLLPMSGRMPFLARLYHDLNVPIFLLTGKIETAVAWQQALEIWLPRGTSLMRFPEPTPLPYDRGPWSERTRHGRITILKDLIADKHPLIQADPKPPLVISSARAFLHKTIPTRRFMTATRVLRVGQMIDLEESQVNWRAIGYEPASVVEEAGQFSRRGGILDIYPVSAAYPVRIELFGNEIDTMRRFDPATQRSLATGNGADVEQLVIPPAREALPGAAHDYAAVLEDEALPEANSLPSWRDDLASLRAGDVFANLEFYLPLLYSQPASLLNYLPEKGLLVIDDWRSLETAVRELEDHADQIANEQPALPPAYPDPLFDWQKLRSELEWWQPLVLGEGHEGETAQPADLTLADAFEPGPRYGGQVRPLITQLKQAQRDNDRVVILSRQASRLSELWREELRGSKDEGLLTDDILPYKPQNEILDLPEPGSLSFIQGGLAEGFVLVRRSDNQILLDLLTDAEIFGWRRPSPRRLLKPRPTAPEATFADIRAGDYVVHLDFGIGLFEGLVTRYVGGNAREYLLVNYAGGDTVYVPVHHADRLGKWTGPDDRAPAIHRLGGKNWSQAKTRAKRAADELAEDLLQLYAARETVSGHAFAPDGPWQAELEASFPHQETDDQLRVIADVKEDMERAQPMDRLICGDVGYGKTEVALRAAFKAVLDSKQVAILVPTTILAQQHYTTFRERLAPFPVIVNMLSRFRTPVQQQRIVTDIRDGRIDIIIGTHRLLSDDVSFKDLGLVIVDEEQRFGVAHKEKLKQWRTEVDVLTMTATPIPRTLHLSLAGVRDISIIDTAPAERLPVQTFVGEMDDVRLHRAILRELDRGGQVFMVHNRVQTINLVQKRIQRLVPEATVVSAHGQMGERHLERIMEEFAEGKIDILISTTIIESGLDFPNANTLIVDRAEQFGLAQLYQLRGRVGRGTRRAYAYFFHRSWYSLNAEAQARLETIAEETQLGAGYTIAMRDMEIRGAGDILGAQQSGHIADVGFDLYTRLLAAAVKKRKAEKRGEKLPVEPLEDTLIDLPLAAYIPTDYVPDASLRLRLYRRMAILDALLEIDEMAEELADRFGPIPDPVNNLLYQLRIKSLALKAGVTGVTTEAEQIRIRMPENITLNSYRLQRYLGDAVRVSKTSIWMSKERGTHNWQVELVQILEKLRTVDQNQSLV
ncbi:MAG: transcription-repair coupling factor [Candidatus Promineifilaceae bacterium]|nr:transcription-repair coupling factor [Candidatus Promineifilaceae bacterium]